MPERQRRGLSSRHGSLMPCVVLSIQQVPSRNSRRGPEWPPRGGGRGAREKCPPPRRQPPLLGAVWWEPGRLRGPSVLARALTPGKEGTDTPAAGPHAFRTVSCEVAFEVLPLQPDRVSLGVAGEASLKIACGWNGKVSF